MIRLLFVIFPHSSRGLPLTVFYAIPVGELLQQYTPLFPKKWKDGGSVLSVISRSPDGWTVSIEGSGSFCSEYGWPFIQPGFPASVSEIYLQFLCHRQKEQSYNGGHVFSLFTSYHCSPACLLNQINLHVPRRQLHRGHDH